MLDIGPARLVHDLLNLGYFGVCNSTIFEVPANEWRAVGQTELCKEMLNGVGTVVAVILLGPLSSMFKLSDYHEIWTRLWHSETVYVGKTSLIDRLYRDRLSGHPNEQPLPITSSVSCFIDRALWR